MLFSPYAVKHAPFWIELGHSGKFRKAVRLTLPMGKKMEWICISRSQSHTLISATQAADWNRRRSNLKSEVTNLRFFFHSSSLNLFRSSSLIAFFFAAYSFSSLFFNRWPTRRDFTLISSRWWPEPNRDGRNLAVPAEILNHDINIKWSVSSYKCMQYTWMYIDLFYSLNHHSIC